MNVAKDLLGEASLASHQNKVSARIAARILEPIISGGIKYRKRAGAWMQKNLGRTSVWGRGA